MDPSSLLLAVVATLVLVGFAHLARRWMEFRTLARALGGTGTGRVFAASAAGVEYTCRYSGGTKSKPSRLSVVVDLPASVPFRVSRGGLGTRLCIALGLGRTVPTGDPVLDRTHVVACDAADWAGQVFGDAGTTAAVREVLRSGFTELRADGERLTAVWSGVRMTGDVDASVVSATVKRLARLRDAIAAVPVPSDAAATSGRRRALAMVPALVFTVGSMLVVWAMSFTLLDRRAVLMDSLRLSLPWLALFLVAGTQMFRLSTTSPGELAAIVLFAVTGFPLAGYATELALNCALDTAPAVEHRVAVVEREVTQHRSTTSYWAVVRSWRGEQPEYVRVSIAQYARLVPKRSELVVVTRPGRLGFEWIVGSEVAR